VKSNTDRKELEAMIHLLDDSDVEVYNHIFERLSKMGSGIIPELENAWSDTFDNTMQERLEELIHKIQFQDLYNDFETYANKGEFDLLTGAVLIARFAYPELKEDAIQEELTKIKREVWLEFNYNLTPLEQINILNQVYFSNLGFDVANANEINESDFFINKTLESKKGHPILVGLLYCLIARKVDLAIYGLNLPSHFALVLCKHAIDFSRGAEDLRNSVIFYMNPHNKGTIFTKDEIEDYLSKIDTESKPEFFSPCSDKRILKLVIKNLMQLYISKNDVIRSRELSMLIGLIL